MFHASLSEGQVLRPFLWNIIKSSSANAKRQDTTEENDVSAKTGEEKPHLNSQSGTFNRSIKRNTANNNNNNKKKTTTQAIMLSFYLDC